MPNEHRFVDAYEKRTGRKLPHLVPAHFVNEMADTTGLSATPRGKKKAEAKQAPADTTTEKEK